MQRKRILERLLRILPVVYTTVMYIMKSHMKKSVAGIQVIEIFVYLQMELVTIFVFESINIQKFKFKPS